MPIKDDLSKAIGAHGMWKARLRAAIASKQLDVPVSIIRSDTQCEFGKWLLSNEFAKELSSNHGKTVQALHAEFHRVAAQVAELALAGKQKDAEHQLANEGAFGRASNKLTLALMSWKDSL